MFKFLRRKPKIKLTEGEAAALLFHYHKHGIPLNQVAAKRLERRLCEFVGVDPKDEYVSPRQEWIDKLFPLHARSHSVVVKSVNDDHVRLEDEQTKQIFDLKPGEVIVLVMKITGIE